MAKYVERRFEVGDKVIVVDRMGDATKTKVTKCFKSGNFKLDSWHGWQWRQSGYRAGGSAWDTAQVLHADNPDAQQAIRRSEKKTLAYELVTLSQRFKQDEVSLTKTRKAVNALREMLGDG